MSTQVSRRPALPPFAVRTAGHVFSQPHHSTPGSRQTDVMLTVFLSGRANYFLEGKSQAVEAGMVGLVPPRRVGILLSDPSDPDDHYYCRFGGGYAMRLAAQVRQSRGARFFRHQRYEEVAECIRKMGPLHRAELPSRMGRAEVLLAEALELLSRPPGPASGPGLTAAALGEYLREHIGEPFRLKPVAEHFGMSPASLCRAAKRLAGRTVLDLAEEMKVEWAGTLLASGAANVSEAARRTGYADAFYFSRVFRKRTGEAPSARAARSSPQRRRGQQR
jgi:AraC-like DNA-binding protein